MEHGSELTIGERLRELRRRVSPPMTQRELAERAEVSVDVVQKLEQGVKQTALIGTLQRLARALDVDLTMLMCPPRPLPSGPDFDHRAGIIAIREALTELPEVLDVGAEEQLLTAEELRRQSDHCWGAYWRGDYSTLGSVLPGLIRQGRATLRREHVNERAAVCDQLARIFQVTTMVASNLAHHDLAHLAVEQAIVAADAGGDPLRSAAVRGTYAQVIQRQGRLAEAHRLTVRVADGIEPKMSQARSEELSVWGYLLVLGAASIGRDNRDDEADELLRLADSVALRLGVDRNDYEVPFGPARAAMMGVDVAVVTGREARALKIAKRFPPDAAVPLAIWSRHLTDVAYAQAVMGRTEDALDTILRVERGAPEWISYQRFPRIVVGELLRQQRRRNSPLAALAGRLNLDPDGHSGWPFGC